LVKRLVDGLRKAPYPASHSKVNFHTQ